MSRVPLRILIVDDDRDYSELLAQILRHHGHQVTVARNGVSALTKARENPPDAVVLDLGLPDRAGYDIARAMREEGILGDGSIIIVLTGNPTVELDRAKAVGIDMLLHKPIESDALGKLVEFVHRRRQRRSTTPAAE